MQCWTNVEDDGTTLLKCYVFCVYWAPVNYGHNPLDTCIVPLWYSGIKEAK